MGLDAGPKFWSKAEAFAAARQFAFACLAPIGLVAVIIALKPEAAAACDVR